MQNAIFIQILELGIYQQLVALTLQSGFIKPLQRKGAYTLDVIKIKVV